MSLGQRLRFKNPKGDKGVPSNVIDFMRVLAVSHDGILKGLVDEDFDGCLSASGLFAGLIHGV